MGDKTKGMSREMYDHIREYIHKVKFNLELGEIETIRGTKGTVCTSTGYLRVKLGNKTCQVHQLLAVSYFGEDCIGKQVNHKDGNKLNNTRDNLELVTRQENVRHQHDNGLAKYAEGHPVRQLDLEGNHLNTYESMLEASKLTGVSASEIMFASRGYAEKGKRRLTAGGFKWEKVKE